MAKFSGKNLTIEINGESHSKEIKAFVKGLNGITFDLGKLHDFLDRRKGAKFFTTSRVEKDEPVFSFSNNVLPKDFSFTIENQNIRKTDYSNLYGKPRPSHADICWFLKDKQLDFCGGGRFSGRLTLPLCVIGGICKQFLESKGIFVEGYIAQTGKVKGISYKEKNISYKEIIEARDEGYPSLSDKEEMLSVIEKAKDGGDSVGARIECIVYNMSVGIGDSLFEGLEGKISSLIYSIPAVKGVEFGLGFDFIDSFAGDVNDQMQYNKNKEIQFLTNNNGGILGGISSGAPITIGVSIKPTPSISKAQKTVDLINKENTIISVNGRHDACIAVRAIPCVESAVAIALTDELIGLL